MTTRIVTCPFGHKIQLEQYRMRATRVCKKCRAHVTRAKRKRSKATRAYKAQRS